MIAHRGAVAFWGVLIGAALSFGGFDLALPCLVVAVIDLSLEALARRRAA